MGLDEETKLELYSYLNLESTKTDTAVTNGALKLYSYLNLESTKTLLNEK